MPIFEYTCDGCGREFEQILQGTDRAACPSCGGRRLTKRLSVFAVGSADGSAATGRGGGPCGTCGDPRGPGSCALD